MGLPQCNTTEEYERIDEAKLWKNMEFHHFGLILSALFSVIAILVSWYLVYQHCTHYLKPWEQKHIIRILFMVPVYAFVSFLSYYYYRHAIYFEVIRDCYEAFAIASFFALLCHYIAPDLHSQKDYFRGLSPRNWILPINWFQKCTGGPDTGFLRRPKSGLTWFNVIWFGVFQYCFIRVFMTCLAVITQAAGRYCLESLNPAFAHIWIMLIEGGCVTIAMYCLIQFYIQTKVDLSEHRPLLKVTAIKLVIFLSFWQTILISFLTSSGLIKASEKIQFPDIKIGIPSMLLCIEMAIFAVFHLWAFPWTVYDVRRSNIVAAESAAGFLPDPKTAYQGGRIGERALMDAFNPWDLIKAVGRAFRWVAVGRRKRHEDISYKGGQGAGLEPTRNQFTAFDDPNARNPFADPASTSSNPKSSNKYYAADEDDSRLLSNAQPNPSSNFPRPMSRHPPRDPALSANPATGAGDHGNSAPPYDPYARARSPYQDASGHLAPSYHTGTAEYGVLTPESSRASEEGDTEYHSPYSAAHSRTRSGQHSRNVSAESVRRGGGVSGMPSAITPDSVPLGPPGRRSEEHREWEQHDRGRGQDESDLGGGLGGRDNRF